MDAVNQVRLSGAAVTPALERANPEPAGSAMLEAVTFGRIVDQQYGVTRGLGGAQPAAVWLHDVHDDRR